MNNSGGIIVKFNFAKGSEYFGITIRTFVICLFGIYLDFKIVSSMLGLPLIAKILLFLALLTILISYVADSKDNLNKPLYLTIFRAWRNKNGRYVQMNLRGNNNKNISSKQIKLYKKLLSITGLNEDYYKSRNENDAFFKTREGYLEVVQVMPVDISQEQQSQLNEYINSFSDIVGNSSELITYFLNHPVSFQRQISYLNNKLKNASNSDKELFLRMKIHELEELELSYTTRAYYFFIFGSSTDNIKSTRNIINSSSQGIKLKYLNLEERKKVIKSILNPFSLGGASVEDTREV